MIYFEAIFWMFVFFFGIIGMIRGWAKELLVSFAVILSLFIMAVLQQFIPFIREAVLNANTGDPQAVFWFRTILLAVLVFFGYQGPSIAKLAGSNKFVREKLQDSLLGMFLGALNGYLVIGTLWYFLHQARYPFPEIMGKDLSSAAQQLIAFLPPQWMLGTPTIYFAVAIAFAFVLVVFL